jgi:hypothetical protein
MDERKRILTPLPLRPVHATTDAVETTHRFLAALIEGDLSAVEAALDTNICTWWTRRGRLASIEGASAFSRALFTLLQRDPPTELQVRPSSPMTAITRSLVNDELCWSLELNVAGGRIVGAYVRGTDLG